MARLIGTAGHVDHGKTSLIKALTGIDADRLPEEKKRGLTIDIGFAFVELPEIGRVSIVDVPGHERFLSNMLVGALGVDVAVLCVAADESVKPQTREHLQILELLPVERLIVALTKADLVDSIALEAAHEDVREILAAGRFADSSILPVSSVTGEGLEALKGRLAEALAAQRPSGSQDWYLPVDRVFTVKGHGAVVTGTLMAGTVREGGEAWIEPGGHRVRVRQIQSHDTSVPEAERGQRVALNLSGIKAEDLVRGMVAASPGTVFASDTVDLEVHWVTAPPKGARIRLSIGADEVVGRVRREGQGSSRAQVRLERPVAVVKGQPFVLRRYSPPDVLGGGTVTVPQGVRKRKLLALAPGGDISESVANLIADSKAGIATDEVCRTVGRDRQALGDTFQSLVQTRRIVGFAGLWFSPEAFKKCAVAFLSALEALHDREPAKAAFSREKVAAAAGLEWQGKPLDRIITFLGEQSKLRVSGGLLAFPGRGATLNAAQRQLLERVTSLLESSGVNVPSPSETALALGVPVQAVNAMLDMGLKAGELVRLADLVWYTPAQIQGLLATAKAKLGGERFSVSQFREALGTSRKYAIPLLEYADARGVTFRQGELRVFNQ
ncbi:MAG: selenocysteine-specific translation elongation factor [Armatimonadetes bacterium]|nr:selenocysteine-specific translation elongation factor [Armatimonadota bacterium]